MELRAIIFVITAAAAQAQPLAVCVTGTCPGGSFTNLNAALNAMTSSSKIIEVYAGQGDVVTAGTCGPDSKVGDYCTGGGISSRNAIELKYKSFCTAASPCIIRTNKTNKLPKDGQRITPDYRDGASPIVASFASSLDAALATYKGAENCQLTLGGPGSTGLSANVDSGICYSCLSGYGGAPSNNGGNAILITEDSTAGVHEATYTLTSSASTLGMRVYITLPPVDAALKMAQPITAAVNNGSGLVRLTVPNHGLVTGTIMMPHGMTGCCTSVNDNNYFITVIDANTIDLANIYNFGSNGGTAGAGSVFSGTYTGGGTLGDGVFPYDPLPGNVGEDAYVSAAQTHFRTVGTNLINGHIYQLDQELITVVSGGGTQNLVTTRGSTSPTGKTTTAQRMHYDGDAVADISANRPQVSVRVDGTTRCIFDITDGLGSVVSGGSACTIAPFGQVYVNFNKGLGGTQTPYWYVATINGVSVTGSSHTIGIGMATGGNSSYTGTSTGKLLINGLQVVDDAGPEGLYRCPPNNYTFKGIEWKGGTNNTTNAYMKIPFYQASDPNLHVIADAPKNITFDQNLFRMPPENATWTGSTWDNSAGGGTRQCIYVQGAVNLLNNWFSGCGPTNLERNTDGGVLIGMTTGPAIWKNNYIDGLASGIGPSPTSNMAPFPTNEGLYSYRADFKNRLDGTALASCNTNGCNGQVEIAYNYTEKPEYVRWQIWSPNKYAPRGSLWYPSRGGYWYIQIVTPGLTGSTEPAWPFIAGNLVTDGAAVWRMQDGYIPGWKKYVTGTHFNAGDLANNSGEYDIYYAWRALTAGTAGGTTLPGSSCTLGQTYSDPGGFTWECWSAINEFGRIANYPYKKGDNIKVSPAWGNNWSYSLAADCTTATGAGPSFPGGAGDVVNDGTCVWRSNRVQRPIPSKNHFDGKGMMGAAVCPAGEGAVKCTAATKTSTKPFWIHHNYFYNSWAQFAAGGGQGNSANFQGDVWAGYASMGVHDVLIEHTVFDQAAGPAISLGGIYLSNDYIKNRYCRSTTDWHWLSKDPRCPWFHYYGHPGVTSDFVIRHVRMSRTGFLPNIPSVGTVGNIQLGGLITNLTIDHTYMDGSQSVAPIWGGSMEQVPIANLTFTNNILKPPAANRHFFCNQVSATNRCSTLDHNNYGFPAMNFIGAQANYTAGMAGAGTWPSQTAAYSDPTKIGGNTFADGTSFGASTAAAGLGENTYPSNNRFDTYSSLGIDSYFRVPAGSPIHNTALDGTDPGPDATQQPILLNVTATPSSGGVTLSFDTTNGSAGVVPVFQLSSDQGFDLGATPNWVPASVDPSLVAPDASGNTVLSSANSAYTTSGNHHVIPISGLTPGATYWYRIHSGGEMVTGSFVASATVTGVNRRVQGRAAYRGRMRVQ